MGQYKLPLAFKKKFLEALRSGKYTKINGKMSSGEEGHYCALGVAHKIAYPEMEVPQKSAISIGKTCVPEILRNHFHLAEDAPERGIDHPSNVIPMMNDLGKTFEEIADYVEREL